MKKRNASSLSWIWLVLIVVQSISASAGNEVTLNGFSRKLAGEEINYFSHLHQFAKTALLTRANGNMPIEWEAPAYHGQEPVVTYEFLMGHSSGTSAAERHFDVSLNGQFLFTIQTPMHKKGMYTISQQIDSRLGYTFTCEEYDINGDAFGRLLISVPAEQVRGKVVFTVKGQQENSRDWLMIFMYQAGLKIMAEPTNLVLRASNKRQLNVYIDNPYSDHTPLLIEGEGFSFRDDIRHGYNVLNIPSYAPAMTGAINLRFVVNANDTVIKTVSLKPVRNYLFHLIHHSHNDIGYSHLQAEVEQIQSRNIRTAMQWIEMYASSGKKPVWHIESLWAVENFLQQCSPAEEKRFVRLVKNGQLVLSANYANILSGLCQPEEQNWVLEYATQLEKKYGFQIRNAMITDIPGITYSALLSYVNKQIPYLSLGPNYVESLPDKGDRVGSVIREQGDQVFYWKPDMKSDKKLLVWTAGKGYSYFHSIAASERKSAWSSRVSAYCEELQQKNYPYDIVQLRYTQHSDNGPVDTTLVDFVEEWNRRYSVPKLVISSVDKLFSEFEQRYAKDIPVRTGEISPYWDDGAYSTAKEEMANRELVLKTLAMEKEARANGRFAENKDLFYRLHRDLIMFHEHTWGSWCSISDPELPFTTQQWEFKKAFLDSAEQRYGRLANKLSFVYRETGKHTEEVLPLTDFTVDPVHGGLIECMVGGKNLVSQHEAHLFFEPVYSLGINPSVLSRTEQVVVTEMESNARRKVVKVSAVLPSLKNLILVYTLDRATGRLTCSCSFDKLEVREKESLHMALPFHVTKPLLSFGSPLHEVHYPGDQLPGSNKEFICVEDHTTLTSADGFKVMIRCPKVALVEIGAMIDENKTNGVKTWSADPRDPSLLYLYVLNNYWHTNFKAYQDGRVTFEMELSVVKD